MPELLFTGVPAADRATSPFATAPTKLRNSNLLSSNWKKAKKCGFAAASIQKIHPFATEPTRAYKYFGKIKIIS